MWLLLVSMLKIQGNIEKIKIIYQTMTLSELRPRNFPNLPMKKDHWKMSTLLLDFCDGRFFFLRGEVVNFRDVSKKGTATMIFQSLHLLNKMLATSSPSMVRFFSDDVQCKVERILKDHPTNKALILPGWFIL